MPTGNQISESIRLCISCWLLRWRGRRLLLLLLLPLPSLAIQLYIVASKCLFCTAYASTNFKLTSEIERRIPFALGSMGAVKIKKPNTSNLIFCSREAIWLWTHNRGLVVKVDSAAFYDSCAVSKLAQTSAFIRLDVRSFG